MMFSARRRALRLALLSVAACSSSSGDTSPTDAATDRAAPDAKPRVDAATPDAKPRADAHADAPKAHDAGVDAHAVDGSAVDARVADASSDAASPCLDPSTFSTFFTIEDSSFCAVAMYTANESLGFMAPSWGAHGGPLTVVADASGGGVSLERWTAPTGTSGALVNVSTDVAAGVPSGAYLGSQAVDLPFFSWTGISWSGPSPATTGDFDLITGGAVATSYTANGPYWVVGVSDGAGQGRLLYTALSPLGSPTMNVNGLYAADACSSPSQELGAGTGCSPSALVAGWGEDSGPVTADANGDVFAVLASSSTDTQEARGFLASSVARGAGATDGTTLFTVPGYSGSLAALSPTATLPGVVAFQPFDATTYDALDVIEQTFTTTSALAAMGTTATMLHVPAGSSSGLSFLVDGSEHLWVAAYDATSTTYVVLARN